MWAANGGVIACSCPGYWWRRTCRHYRAYRDAVALVLAQDVFNQTYSPIGVKLTPMGESVSIHHTGQVVRYG